MVDSTRQMDRDECLARLEAAARSGKPTAAAVHNIRHWLTEPRYSRYVDDIAAEIAAEQWQTLDDLFWTVIPFGTGGRRGRMHAIGTNAINDRTMGESAQGLADYVKDHREGNGPLSCAIAYDTRHRSRQFAELCAGIMVAAGFKVYFLDGYRSTPELSFLVRHRRCSCGIMITASHNPPSDNGFKAYWSTGGQILPPHDKGIIERVLNVQDIRQVAFDQAVANGDVVLATSETGPAFVNAVVAQRRPGARDLRIIYSPLHGVGESAVCPVLAADGFEHVEVFEPHRQPDGNFPNVPQGECNPEKPIVFDAIYPRAKEIGADVILATDPDCDRMGCAAPLTLRPGAPWATFTGNQLGALLADFVLENTAGRTRDHYLIKTLVTTEMIRRIGESYGVQTYGDLPVGFKWIGELMEVKGPERFLLGMEESHGYLAGQYARDKDGALACMFLAELAAAAKAAGKSLHEKLDDLYWQHGYHAERLLNVFMEGSEGMARMQALMKRFREQPPASLAGLKVAKVRDYLNQCRIPSGERWTPISGEKYRENMVVLYFAEEGNLLAVRPSGTEPKIKLYLFTFVPPEQLHDLDATKHHLAERLQRLENDVKALVDAV
jgi:phosphomannomutase